MFKQLLNLPFSEADRPPAVGLNNIQNWAIPQQGFRFKEIKFHVYIHLRFQVALYLLNR